MDDEDRLGLVPRGYGFASAELTLPLPEEQDDYRNYHGHKYSKKNWNQQLQQLQQPGSGAQPPSQTLSSAPFEGSIHPQSDLVEAPQLLQLDPSQSHQQQAHQQHQSQNQQRLVRPSPPPFQHVNLPAGHPHPHSHLHVHPTQPPQPYHHLSQPPRLPPLAVSLSSISISPFDPFNTREGGNYFLSSTISPAPAPPNATLSSIPRLPAQADDIVLPISETRSSIPALRSLDRGNERIAHSPAAVPLTRFTPSTLRRQPTPDSLAGISLFDDQDFELSLGATGRSDHSATSVSRFASAAVTSVVAHDVAHLTTDERSDDWFKFTAPESTISSYTNPHPEAHKIMTVAIAADRSSVPEQQQQSAQFAAATTSFTPLPPIRRTSTFDLLRKKGLVNDDSDTSPSPIEKDIPPAVSPVHADAAQQTSNGQLSAGQSASDSSPHSSVQLRSQQNLNLHGQSQPPMPQHPNGLVAAGPAGQTGISQHPTVMQMNPHQIIMGRNGPASQQVAPGQVMINGQVQTIISGGRQWIVQESHLAEPLHPSNRNRSANSPQSYSAYDKETEGEGGPPPPPGAAASQPPPTRPRNMSNTVPPTTAMRYPTLFPPASSAEQHPFQRQQAQVPLPQHPLLRGQNSSVGSRDIFDDRSSKDMGVRVDQVSVSSIASEEVNDKPRRGSGSLFSIGHRRNSSSATAVQQGSSDGPPEKKKNFFASVTGITHSQPRTKSNLGLTKTSTFDESDQASLQNPGDNVPVKKRLSELKGMVKGVVNAKEGAKDDQPVKVETIYESRQSMQGPPRNNPALTAIQGAQRQVGPFGPHAQPGQFGPQGQPDPYGLKASMQAHPSQMGQPVTMNPAPFNGIGRAATAGPQSGHIQQVKSEESGKKGSAGGFLGGLFNKQANKTKEIKSQSPQQRPPSSQRPTQSPSMQPSHLPFSAVQMQMHLPGQQIGPHPMFAGQPQFQRGPPGQSPSPTLFQDPTQPPPSLQTAQVVTIRRPSEITVSTQGTQQPSNQRPNMPSPPGSQGTFKQHPGSSQLGQRSIQMGSQNDGNIVASQTSPQLSDKSSREKLTIGASSTITRISPNRKPVGSANFKGDGPFMTSAISPSVVRPERSTASPSPRPSEQQRAPSQLSQARQSPQSASFGVSTDMRQPSLPSPVPSLVPSQSNHSSSPRLQGDQFARGSPEQGLGVFPYGMSQPGPMNTSGPGGAPNALVWGPNGFRPAAPALAPPSAAARIQPPLAPSSPVPSMDQSKLSKFFGAYDGGKPAAQPQPQPQANKEKSAASKFLGAFKRSSKHNEASQPQQRPRTSPRIPQTAIRPGVPGPAASGVMPNPGSIPGSSGAPVGQSLGPVQPGQGRGQVPVQVTGQQMQAGRGQPGQIPPHMITMQEQAGRGQNLPGMILGAGRGQPPPMFAAARPLPPQMQHPGAAGQRGNEPKYDQVPIPRGYEAVHGYGPGGMLAPSPYNAGRPGLPPMQYAQYPPTMQPGFPPRQWDPRVMQPSQAGLPLGATPGNPQPASQGLPNNIPSQGPLQDPQLQRLTQNTPPNTQNLQLSPSQIQLSQQFPPSQSAQESRQLSAPGQSQIPIQRASSVQFQQAQSHGQGSQQGSSPASQAQSNVNWRGTPEKTQSPASVRQPNPPASNSVPPASVQVAPVSGSPASNGTPPPQSQHIAATVPSQPPQLVQANPVRQTSPVNQMANASIQVPVVSSQGQYDVQSPRSIAPTGGFLRSPDATRLTSRMSVSRQSIKSASPSTEKLADRTMSVSPEPPGPRHVPLHQVSEQNLSVNVERANNHMREGSEDIYDATPRLNNSKFQGEDQVHENTKYAGSEKSRVVTNGAAVAAGAAVGAGAGASSGSGSGTVTEDNMSFLDGPDDSEPDDSHAAEELKEKDLTISPPQRTATMNMEPEEKILVDEPVELAAVNDDDDGIPTMTATSYPGQEWNPYGAGEFGDWE